MNSARTKYQSTLMMLVMRYGRPVLTMGVMTAIMCAITVACGGGGNSSDGRPPGDNRPVVMETFTPTVVGEEPDAEATQAARQIVAAATATAHAENPPSATATPALAEVPEDTLRPPLVWLSDGTDQIDGVFGSYGLIDEATGTQALIGAYFYDVGDIGLNVAGSGELKILVEDDAEMPTSLTASIFTWAGNSGIPGDMEGNVGDYPWFVQATDPVRTTTLNPGSPVFTMPDEPDRYVVQVEIHWPAGDQDAFPTEIPIYAIYAFTVYVS